MLAMLLVAAVAATCSDAAGAARQQPPPPTDAGGVPEQVTDGVVASVGLVRSAGVFGSGWVVAPGAVVTNEHVARTGTGDIYIDYSDGERVECYTVVSDRDMDLAVLKCDTGGRRPVALGGTAVPDTPVVAVGYPEGVGPTVTAGRITDERPVVRGIDTVGFTAAIEPGSSGSPVVDPSGRVLAIATFGGGFGVPVDRLRPLVEVAEQYPATKAGGVAAPPPPQRARHHRGAADRRAGGAPQRASPPSPLRRRLDDHGRGRRARGDPGAVHAAGPRPRDLTARGDATSGPAAGRPAHRAGRHEDLLRSRVS